MKKKIFETLNNKSTKRDKQIMELCKRTKDIEALEDEKKVKYVLNELNVIFIRYKQIKNYVLKINAILDGKQIEDIEKEYPPITFHSLKQERKNKKKNVQN